MSDIREEPEQFRHRKVLQAWCYGNWMTIPADQRKAVTDHLYQAMPAQLLADLKYHHRHDGIGGGDLSFHDGLGRAIRNTIRGAMPDDQLPGVFYLSQTKEDRERDGPAKNWDDYYTGALVDLCNTYPDPTIGQTGGVEAALAEQASQVARGLRDETAEE